MENMKIEDQMELPAGFRFHPTDEELITHYLSNKVIDSNFSAVAIGEVDMNKFEPWELPWKAKLGEKEWYFFCVRDKKYPTGLRTNRATPSGYWKATGKDKEIYRGKTLVGMKKTLVFYMGRAPKGQKSNWVCHEYRLDPKFFPDNLPKSSRNDWVISRVFHKTSSGKKVHISGLMKMDPKLPPLTDPSPPDATAGGPPPESSHVHCFSNAKIEDGIVSCLSNPLDSFLTVPGFPCGHGFQDSSIIRSFLGCYGQELNRGPHNNGMSTESSSVVSNVESGKKALEEHGNPGIQDLGCIWGY